MKVLIIEDEKSMVRLLSDFLKKQGFQVIFAYDGEKGLDIVYEQEDIDIILLDVMLPKLDGWSVLREIKKEFKMPVIMLTARGQVDDEVFGLELGADEYISKPFDLKILLARINLLLRKIGKGEDEKVIEIANLKINLLAHKVYVDEEEIKLTLNEFELLKFLIENQKIALTRIKILNGVWGYDYYGDVRTVDTHIKRLRKKLGEFSKYIKTVRGIGYMVEV